MFHFLISSSDSSSSTVDEAKESFSLVQWRPLKPPSSAPLKHGPFCRWCSPSPASFSSSLPCGHHAAPPYVACTFLVVGHPPLAAQRRLSVRNRIKNVCVSFAVKGERFPSPLSTVETPPCARYSPPLGNARALSLSPPPAPAPPPPTEHLKYREKFSRSDF